jgi:thymidylate synthase
MHNRDIYTAWISLLNTLIRHGKVTSPRNLKTLELLGVSLRVDTGLGNIIYHPYRNLNYKFMVAEWLWIVEGSNQVKVLSQYNKKIAQFSDDGETLAGAYGPRINAQLDWVHHVLVLEDTRQAVITIWTPTPAASKDIPCTVALQFLKRGEYMNLIVTMRSSDAWLGIPYDFYSFSMLLNLVASYHGCQVGFVQMNLGSSHLYETDLAEAKKVINSPGQGMVAWSPRVPYDVPLDVFRTLHDPTLGLEILPAPWGLYQRVLREETRRADAFKVLTE